jgi:hypothetical protein
MNDQVRLIPSDLQPADEAELTRIVQTRVESMGRRSAHPADKIAAARLAAEVVRHPRGQLRHHAGASRCPRLAAGAPTRIPPLAPTLGLARVLA